MWSISKKLFTLALLSLLFYTVVKASIHPEIHQLNPITQNPFVEEIKLSSSRFSQVDDLSIVDENHHVTLTPQDVKTLENDFFELYLNETTLGIKVKDKATGYIWNTVIDNAQAGTFSDFFRSSIGFDYFRVKADYARFENVGIISSEFDVDITTEANKLSMDIFIGGLCDDRTCRRNYQFYLAGDERFTLERMIEEFGYVEVNVSFTVEITLTDQGITTHIPFESIVEGNKDYARLSSITLFPGLGATRKDDIPGYMVIPDGVGTLIRYRDNSDRFVAVFEERFYGGNIGIRPMRSSISSYPLSMPVFGAVHGVNQHAMMGIIESGDLNARLIAYPSGSVNQDYNLIFTKFDIHQTFRQSFLSDGTGGALRLNQGSESDITIHHTFLHQEDANYVGIARSYQNYLVSEGILTPNNSVRDTIPIHIQYLMADSKNQFIGTQLVTMSTVSDVVEMYTHFLDEGLDHQRVSLLGWNRGGYSGHLPSALNYERSLGSSSDFDAMIALINELNEILLVNNYVYASNETRSINTRTDVAQGINRFRLEYDCNSCVYSKSYALYPSTSKRLALDHYDDYVNYDVLVLMEDLASMLFSYHQRQPFMRSDTYTIYEEIMEQYLGIASYYFPNAYAYRFVNDFYHAPLFNSQLSYFDDLVPFLPIVLSGHMELFSPFLNFNSLGTTQLLMLIDFNINPSYILSKERSSHLSQTDIEHLYATRFSSWEATVIEEYNFINQALSHVINASIINREVMDLGVVKVSYSNGVDIIINYTSQVFTEGDMIVEPMNYLVRGHDE